MMRPTIGCLYSCSACGIRDVEVRVPAREEEDVVVWLERVCAVAIGADHVARSPHCRAQTMENLKIPMTGTDRIGGAAIN